MRNTNKILVTGGAGFIGANFVYYWLKHHPNTQVINLDALTYAGNVENLAGLSENRHHAFVRGNILDKELVDKVMADVDMVVHFAAETHVDRSIMDPSVFVETNVLGTQVLLDSALKNGIKHFHHISTDEVFGSLGLGSQKQFDEHTSYDPRSPYSASKAGSDHLVRAYGETFGLSFTLTNCSNNYGAYQFPEKFIPLAIINLLLGKKIPIYGDGLNVRDWLFVEDHCAGIEKVILEGRVGDTYMIGGLKKDVSNLELAKMLLSLMDKTEDELEYIKDRPGHDRRYSVNWQKIHTELGWEPTVSLEEGLLKTIRWYEQNQNWWQPLLEKNQQYYKKQYGQ